MKANAPGYACSTPLATSPDEPCGLIATPAPDYPEPHASSTSSTLSKSISPTPPLLPTTKCTATLSSCPKKGATLHRLPIGFLGSGIFWRIFLGGKILSYQKVVVYLQRKRERDAFLMPRSQFSLFHYFQLSISKRSCRLRCYYFLNDTKKRHAALCAVVPNENVNKTGEMQPAICTNN